MRQSSAPGRCFVCNAPGGDGDCGIVLQFKSHPLFIHSHLIRVWDIAVRTATCSNIRYPFSFNATESNELVLKIYASFLFPRLFVDATICLPSSYLLSAIHGRLSSR
jgi:hypothetical protein